MTLANDELLAPWSVSLAHGAAFTISGSTNSTLVSPTPARPCSSATAIGFIEKFCRLHSIHDQSLAALAAVLLLPSLKGLKSSSLPALRIKVSKPNLSMVAQEQQQRRREKQFIELPRVPQKQDLDLLLTASCYCTGIDTILFSVFFEPGVECNKAGPWLQGALDVANDLLESDPWVLGRMLMDRLPQAAPLWLGVTILGLHSKFMKQAGYGQLPVNLNSAAWTGTIQSFIQQPVSTNLNGTGRISRADECRLLFLAQADDHSHVPFCQWVPFGTTELQYADIEVRIHEDCREHALQYAGFIWNCVGGESRNNESGDSSAVSFEALQHHATTTKPEHWEVKLTSPEDLKHTKEFISEVSTRSIFRWLRPDGQPLHEKELWEHDWLEIYESDEEDEVGLKDDQSGPKSIPHVSSWLEGLEPPSTKE